MATQPVAAPRLSKLQQKRSRETRAKLMSAALQLWRDHGFDETTVAEVCDAAGVSKGTFYFYFPRKEDLLLELAVTTSERTWEEAQKLLAGEAATPVILKEIIIAMAKRTQRTPRPLLARTVEELLGAVGQRWEHLRGDRQAFGTVFTAVFDRAKKRGELKSFFHPADLASMLTILLLQGMLGWAWGEYPVSLERVLWSRAILVLQGGGIRVDRSLLT